MTARERLIGLLKAWERDRVIDRPPDRDEMPLIVKACAEVADEIGVPAPSGDINWNDWGKGVDAARDLIVAEIRACLKEANDAR